MERIQNGYHISIHNQLVPCYATKRVCRKKHYPTIEMFQIENSKVAKPTLQYYRDVNRNSLSFKIVPYKDELFTVSYLHGGIDFTNRWNRLARGLTFDKEGNIVLVGFEKFFNDKQLEDYEQYDEQFKTERARVDATDNEKLTCYEKLDGSMVILGVYKNELIASTTSSVGNDYAKRALDYIKSLPNAEQIKQYLLTKNSCLIFEYTGNENLLKVMYDYPIKMTIIGEVSKDTLADIETTDTLGFEQAKEYKMTYDELVKFQKENRDQEGFVVKNKYGNRIKFKTEWWFEKGKHFGIFFSPQFTRANVQEVIKSVQENTIDDLLAYQNTNQHWAKQNKVGKIYNVIKGLERSVSNMLLSVQGMDNPIRVIATDDTIDPIVKPLVISRLKGRQIDYSKFVDTIKDLVVRTYGRSVR